MLRYKDLILFSGDVDYYFQPQLLCGCLTLTLTMLLHHYDEHHYDILTFVAKPPQDPHGNRASTRYCLY
jgi:hypothetical protein